MCPDRTILSVYFDNELDSPWREKLETHLAGCADCRSRLEIYGKTRDRFGFASRPASFDAAMEAAQGRIGEQLEPFMMRRYEPARNPRTAARGFCRGSFKVPVPVAAAAGLVLAAAFSLLIAIRPHNAAAPQIADTGANAQITQAAANMDNILKYLDDEGGAEMVIIRLPETTFKSEGEPKMIRAADYTRDAVRR
jgi:anti-sigma factor RsiW